MLFVPFQKVVGAYKTRCRPLKKNMQLEILDDFKVMFLFPVFLSRFVVSLGFQTERRNRPPLYAQSITALPEMLARQHSGILG